LPKKLGISMSFMVSGILLCHGGQHYTTNASTHKFIHIFALKNVYETSMQHPLVVDNNYNMGKSKTC